MEKIKHCRLRFTKRPSLKRRLGRITRWFMLGTAIFWAMGLFWYGLWIMIGI